MAYGQNDIRRDSGVVLAFCVNMGGYTMLSKESVEKKKRQETLQKILNHQVVGEIYISTSPSVWKSLTLKYFNKIYRKEMDIIELMDTLEKQGIIFNQKRTLVIYPIREYLYYIAKETKKEIKIEERIL